MQYVLVGLALCIFYTLLLSLSEYIDFNFAYLVAATATVLLITLYTKSIFEKWSIGMFFGIFLGLLYAFILVLIQHLLQFFGLRGKELTEKKEER